MEKQTKKKRVYYESAKIRATSHWDLDYMPLKEVEAHFAQLAEQNTADQNPKPPTFRLSSFFLGLILLALGVFLLLGAVVVGRYAG